MAAQEPARLVLLARGENALFEIDTEVGERLHGEPWNGTQDVAPTVQDKLLVIRRPEAERASLSGFLGDGGVHGEAGEPAIAPAPVGLGHEGDAGQGAEALDVVVEDRPAAGHAVVEDGELAAADGARSPGGPRRTGPERWRLPIGALPGRMTHGW